MDVKINLVSRGLYRAVLPPEEGVALLEDQLVYTVLYLIRSHIHPDHKAKILVGRKSTKSMDFP
jgi:hypothetical protein